MTTTTTTTTTTTPTTTIEMLSEIDINDIKQVFILTRGLVKPRKITYPCGAVYKGETKERLRHGWGEILYPNSTVIAAKWVNGVATGKGVYMSYEMTYKGDFVNNAFHGKGKLIYHDDNEYYEGSFVNNQKHGHGSLLFPSGCSCTGNWENDELNGLGVLYAQGNKYTGTWTNSKLDSDGVVTPFSNLVI